MNDNDFKQFTEMRKEIEKLKDKQYSDFDEIIRIRAKLKHLQQKIEELETDNCKLRMMVKRYEQGQATKGMNFRGERKRKRKN